MGTTYTDAALRIPEQPAIAPTTRATDERSLTLVERLTTFEALAFAGIALVLLVLGVITGITGVYLLALVAVLTAANFVATARAAADGTIETAPTQLG